MIADTLWREGERERLEELIFAEAQIEDALFRAAGEQRCELRENWTQRKEQRF